MDHDDGSGVEGRETAEAEQIEVERSTLTGFVAPIDVAAPAALHLRTIG